MTRAWKNRLLAVPTFHKILGANSAIVAVGAVLGTLLTARVATTQGIRLELVLGLALAGTVLSVGVNMAVLKAAFIPLQSLERVLDEVRRGNLTARASRTALRDPDIERMAETLNRTLDAVQSYSGQVKALSRQVLAAQEAERLRIARELHDQTAQALTYMLIRLKVAERANPPAEVKEALEELHQLTLKTLDDIRRLAVELRPTALDDLGLVAALQNHIKGYSQRLGVPVDFTATGLEERLPKDVEVVVYRVVQEALTNVAKYAEATHVAVSLHRQGPPEEGLSLAVKDNGRGFDRAALKQSGNRGLGLFGMEERVHLVGGRIQWDTAPGRGTEVRAWIPLEGGYAVDTGNDGD
mgnify:CR=1 FL=1